MPKPLPTKKPRPELVKIAEVTGAHGIKGAFTLRSLTENPMTVFELNPMLDDAGIELFAIECIGNKRGTLIARSTSVADRNAADALRGTALYVSKARLPPAEEDEFFADDLIGLSAVDLCGIHWGTIKAVLDFGGGDIIEVEKEAGDSVLLPFSRDVVPELDLDAGRATVIAPLGFEL